MAAFTDSILGYLSEDSFFVPVVDEGDDESQPLEALTLNCFVDANNSDFDSSDEFNEYSSIFYNVFPTEAPEDYLGLSEATDYVFSWGFEPFNAIYSNGDNDELGFEFGDGSRSSHGVTVESLSLGLHVDGRPDPDSEGSVIDRFGDELCYVNCFDTFEVLDCGIRWDSAVVDQGIFDANPEWVEVNEPDVVDAVVDLSAHSEIFSEISTEDALAVVESDSEWSVLLSFNRGSDFHLDHVVDGDGLVSDEEGDVSWFLAGGVMVGNPPAAKSFVQNLQLTVLPPPEDLGNGNQVHCVICNDEVSFVEKVMELPCCHYFHGDCILPWLNIRNTCPICRYEFPTDDPEYEQRKKVQQVG